MRRVSTRANRPAIRSSSLSVSVTAHPAAVYAVDRGHRLIH